MIARINGKPAAAHVLHHYVRLENERFRLMKRNETMAAKIEANDASIDELIREQERLTARLGPALTESGPVYWKLDDGGILAIRSSHDESILIVDRLNSPHKVELPPDPDPEPDAEGGEPRPEDVVAASIALIDQEV